MQRFIALACALVMNGVVIAGCSAPSEPVTSTEYSSPGVDMSFFGRWQGSSGETGLPGFYPIAIGNTWRYERNVAVSIHSGDDVSTTYMNGAVQHRQLCHEDRGGRRYVLQQHLDGTGFELAVTYLRVREDRGGLYEADVPLNEPGCPGLEQEPASQTARETPASLLARVTEGESDPVRRAAFERAARVLLDRLAAARSAGFGGGVSGFSPRSGDLLRLRYPLYPGQRWVVRASPRFTGFAEESESVATGAGPQQAWRIRTESELFSPADRVYTWYGESGFIQMSLHLESNATDNEGNPIGRVHWDELLRLEDLDLVGS